MQSSVPILLLLQCLVIGIHAFADYLLAGGGCWTDLSPDEVIMNAKVVDSSNNNNNLQIEVKGYPVNENQQVILASFPQKVQVQVVISSSSSSQNDKNNGDAAAAAALFGDYQFVVDVVDAKGAKFSQEGACEGERQRVSGRQNDVKELLVEQEGASLIAGWASGHEAVKLTRTVTFVSASSSGGGGGQGALSQKSETKQQEENVPQQQQEQQQQQPGPDVDWTDGLVKACAPNVLTADRIQGFRVDHSSVELQATLVGDNQLQIHWAFSDSSNNKPRLVLVSSSTDATFAGGVCGDGGGSGAANNGVPENAGPRRLVSEQEEIPLLTIHQPHTVMVYAFTFWDDGNLIQRTDPFVLHWVPDKSLQEPAQPRQPEEDPQKLVDAQVRADPNLLQQQAQAYQRKDRKPHKKGKETTSHDDAVNEGKARDNDEEQVEVYQKDRIQGEVMDRLNGRANLLHRHHRREETTTEGQQQQQHGHDGHHHHPHHPYEFHLSDFQVGRSYYAGIAIFIVSPVVVVQLCLRASRRSKGRRRL